MPFAPITMPVKWWMTIRSAFSRRNTGSTTAFTRILSPSSRWATALSWAGGLGIFGASQFRVVTEKSRLAVPEITIGLFPDAGASWTLKNMAPHHAEFLGLTGSHVNASDALLTGMGTHAVAHDARAGWLDDLQRQTWSSDAEQNGVMLQAFLDAYDAPQLPAGELGVVPEHEIDYDDLLGEVSWIQQLAGTSDWVDRGIANLTNGCPATAGVVLEQLKRVAGMSLADALSHGAVTVATHCANNPDFAEGVRALLIDKDNAPAWRYGSVADLPRSYVISHFEEPWPQHPLADLGDGA